MKPMLTLILAPILLSASTAPSALILPETASAATLQQEPYTPPAGSEERKVILDVFRRAWKRQGNNEITDVVFVVRHLRVQKGWAYLVVDPQSSDGTQKYETESALLRDYGESTWKVASRGEGVAKTKKRFPSAPSGIFP
jgi:hypothetical protein